MYQWDNNGNLLNDGVYTNTYDAADRLITTTQGANVYAFRYNGLGDRLKQTANSAVTTYTLDLNAGLTQVLADGSNTYLYGVMRIGEQQPGGFAYHLADALGSVRQLANASASVTLAKSYEPYGNALSSAGSGSSVFAFTGEQYDTSTNLLYLRARYYSGAQGRFLTADTWPGDHLRPASLNGWSYAEANPVNLTDPSGHCVFVGPACVIFVAGVAIVVYVAAIPAGQYLVEHSDEIAEEVEDIIGECERIVEDAFRKPFVGPIGDPFLPPLPQPQPTAASESARRLYHGTTKSDVPSILARISLTIGRPDLDFGQGFYTTASLIHTRRIARLRSLDRGGTPAIVVFDVPVEHLYSLSHLVFDSANAEWERFVLRHRSLQGSHSYDWVEGPVAQTVDEIKGVVTALPYPEYHPLCYAMTCRFSRTV